MILKTKKHCLTATLTLNHNPNSNPSPSLNPEVFNQKLINNVLRTTTVPSFKS